MLIYIYVYIYLTNVETINSEEEYTFAVGSLTTSG